MSILDISRAGQDAWEGARKQYTDKIDRVESQITNRLRDRLGAAKTGAEMFRVFSEFNPLFFRPRIRGAIQEYQAALLQQVSNEQRMIKFSGASVFYEINKPNIRHRIDVIYEKKTNGFI